MTVQSLVETIARMTTDVALVATALFALSWSLGSLLNGAPIPFRDFKQWGSGLMMDAVKASFLLAVQSAVFALIAWIASALCAAA